MTPKITINNWTTGVGKSAHAGFERMTCVDVNTAPGVAMANQSPTKISYAAVSQTFTADDTNDRLTFAANLDDLCPVTVSSTTTLPAGLSAATTYFVIRVSATQCKLATTFANAVLGTQIDITDAGTGTHTITTVNMGEPKWMDYDESGNVGILDSNGRFWYYTSSQLRLVSTTTPTNTDGNGLCYWKGYWIILKQTTADAWASGSGTLTAGFLTGLTSVAYHPAIWGQDDILYYGNGRYVGSLTETTGDDFDPTDAASFSNNLAALDIPEGYIIMCLEELGDDLLSGTVFGATQPNNRIGDIFPWDRVSSSFNLPIHVDEAGIFWMKTSGNLTYFGAGNEGRIYVTNGSVVKQVSVLPENITQTLSNIRMYPGAVETARGRILFGVGDSVGASVYPMGVWGLIPDGSGLSCEHTVSTGNSGSGGTKVYITSLLSASTSLLYVGWVSGTTNGIDKITFAGGNRYGSSEAVIDTQMYAIGTPQSPTSLSHFDIELDTNIASGQSVTLQYRKKLGDSWTTAVTFSYALAGAVGFVTLPYSIQDVSTIQFRIILDTAGSTDTPRLKSIYAY